MNKLKYWLLVVAALVKAFTPSILMFGSLLFNDSALYRYNYCLVRFDNKMYVIEPVDLAKCTYVRKQVEYHPLQHMI